MHHMVYTGLDCSWKSCQTYTISYVDPRSARPIPEPKPAKETVVPSGK